MRRPNARQGSYITARGEGAEYSALTQASVISLNALPEKLMNPNFCFMSRDIPDEKHASSPAFIVLLKLIFYIVK